VWSELFCAFEVLRKTKVTNQRGWRPTFHLALIIHRVHEIVARGLQYWVAFAQVLMQFISNLPVADEVPSYSQLEIAKLISRIQSDLTQVLISGLKFSIFPESDFDWQVWKGKTQWFAVECLVDKFICHDCSGNLIATLK